MAERIRITVATRLQVQETAAVYRVRTRTRPDAVSERTAKLPPCHVDKPLADCYNPTNGHVPFTPPWMGRHRAVGCLVGAG